jgi:hypothetical protein
MIAQIQADHGINAAVQLRSLGFGVIGPFGLEAFTGTISFGNDRKLYTSCPLFQDKQQRRLPIGNIEGLCAQDIEAVERNALSRIATQVSADELEVHGRLSIDAVHWVETTAGATKVAATAGHPTTPAAQPHEFIGYLECRTWPLSA